MAAPTRPKRERRIDLGALGALAAAAVVFVGGLIGLGANVDLLAKHQEEIQAQNALESRIHEIGALAIANSDWDDAVANTEIHYDLEWVKQNIGVYYTQAGKYNFVYLLDETDRPVFANSDGSVASVAGFSALKASAAPLIATVRAAERRRGRLFPDARKRVITSSIQANDVAHLGSHLIILTATLIQPEFGSALPNGPRSFIVVTGRQIDGPFLKSLQDRLLLNDVHLAAPIVRGSLGASISDWRSAQINLRNRSGQILARLAWAPLHPGADLVSVAMLPILLGVGTPLALYFKGRRTSARLSTALAELRLARDSADAASEHKTQFLATMSHEIRTPLNGVLATVQLMEMDVLSAAQRDRLNIVRQSGDALLTVVNDILDLTRIEAGRLELDSQPFSISELAAALEALYEPVAQSKGLSFVVDVHPQAAGVWRGDPHRLRQVCANLVSNALKFTQDGRVRVAFTRPDEGVLGIGVSDTGMGIAAERLEHIFQAFGQAENSISGRFGGSGLGLSICRQLVELMGGSIEVESREGEGSTFHVQAPLQWVSAEVEDAAPRAVHLAEPLSRLHVLAADDNLTNRRIIAAILGSFDCSVDLVDNGEAAVEAWRSVSYDVILMDVQMPVMDGVAATRLIRADEAARSAHRTPIIALTANAMSHQLSSYREAGMDDVVSKPINIADLQQALAKATRDKAVAAQTPDQAAA